MNLATEVLITGGLIAATAAVGVICTWLGCRLQFLPPFALVLASAGWGVMGMAVVALPSLGGIAAKVMSLETPLDTVSQIATLVVLFYAGLGAPKHEGQEVGGARLRSGLAAAGLGLVLASVAGRFFGSGWQHSTLVAALAMAPSLAIVTVIDGGPAHLRIVVAASNRFNQTLAGFVVGVLLIFTIFRANSDHLVDARNNVVSTILLVKTALFFGFAWFLGSRYARGFAKNPKEDLTIRLLLGFILLLVLLYVYASQFLGQLAALVWAYLAGVLFAKAEFRQTLLPGLRRLTYFVCLPLLFFTAGLKARNAGWSLLAILAVAFGILGRVLGASVAARRSRQEHEPLTAGLLAMPQAEMAVILAGYALPTGLVSDGEFKVLIAAAILTTLLDTLFARRVMPPLALAVGSGLTTTQGSLT